MKPWNLIPAAALIGLALTGCEYTEYYGECDEERHDDCDDWGSEWTDIDDSWPDYDCEIYGTCSEGRPGAPCASDGDCVEGLECEAGCCTDAERVCASQWDCSDGQGCGVNDHCIGPGGREEARRRGWGSGACARRGASPTRRQTLRCRPRRANLEYVKPGSNVP